MMVEMVFDSSQDFGMANGALPQWKRELLQRRAARGRPPGAAPAPAPGAAPAPPPARDDQDEELRYGPGIVKRLKSRYLSLALRDAPRRRPSVLRRAASLEHLLDERPPPAPRPARAPRPASLAAPPARAPAPRRDFVKRARSVDALSRLEPCDPPAPPSPSPPPPPPPPPPAVRAPRPPRRPAPLLREAERPPADVVRSALRKFESAPPRRPAAAARLPAVLRGLERGATPDREPEPREPSPAPEPAHPTPAPPALAQPAPAPEPESAPPSPPSSPPPAPSPSPPPTLPCTPVPAGETPELANIPETIEPSVPSLASPEPVASGGAESRAVSRAALDGIARAGSSVRFAFEARAGSHLPPLAATNPVLVARRVGVIRPMPAPPRPAEPAAPAPLCKQRPLSPEPAPTVNGHSTPEPRALSRIGAAGIERAWSGSPARRPPAAPAPAPAPAPWARAAGRGRAPPPASTSVVFNFSNRKEVPDYIENDGIILRGSRRNRIKAGEPGVVVLRPEELEPGSEPEEPDGPEAAPEPCAVRFVNDNVLINGRSSMPARPRRDPARAAKLKLQFDDSLTRTHEYPSETSLCEDEPPAAPAPAPAAPAPLAHNTHLASAALSRYTPSKTPPAAFTLGVTRRAPPAPAADLPAAEEVSEPAHALPCGAGARAWSDARSAATDLLF